MPDGYGTKVVSYGSVPVSRCRMEKIGSLVAR
jgi:hypothetical protein